MNIKKLWTKLFTKNAEQDEIALHVSGATVRHRSPFEKIKVNRNKEQMSQDFIDKWVKPFYMSELWRAEENVISSFTNAAKEIDINIVKKQLGDFNWRMRISGAYFAAIKNYKELDEEIGKHLVKSEVAYAGSGYCLALVRFNTDAAKHYVKTYLEYYLDRKDLGFNQEDAFCALEYLDKKASEKLYDKYLEFVSDKPNWDLDHSRKIFSNYLTAIQQISYRLEK